MKTKTRFVFVLFLISTILIACGQSQAELDVLSTQVAFNSFATQTAQAPTATITPEPTETATPVPTATAIPSATPNQTATAKAATDEASLATQQARQTATAESAQATQQAEDALWAQLAQDGTITFKKGNLHTVDDFEESWAQRNWYQWWSFGYNLSDFVIMTHIEWEIPEDSTFGVGGCGFAIRIKDESNHLVIFLTPHNSVSLGAMTLSGFQYQTFHWRNPDLPLNPSTPPALIGSADFIVVAEKEFVTAYVNGEKVYQWFVALTSRGDLGYTIVSGTNKDFGIYCNITNTRIWDLVK